MGWSGLRGAIGLVLALIIQHEKNIDSVFIIYICRIKEINLYLWLVVLHF